MPSLTREKQEIRREIRKRLKEQKQEQRWFKSKQIEEKLFRWDVFDRARIIMFYLAIDGEVDTSNMIKKAIRLGKEIAVPAIYEDNENMTVVLLSGLDKELEAGPYGIRQPRRKNQKPVPLDNLDIIVTPGLAFDRQNNRLGRGKGYYDRLLADKPAKTSTVGLAFDFQVLPHLPHTIYDQPVDHLISA